MDETSKSIEEINKEWAKLRPEIIKAKGDMCIYCGAKATEYHHIVPRHMGGDNRLSNIVPLCYECHKKAHSKRSCGSHENLGRKPVEIPDNFDLIADIYLGNHIRLKDALEATGLKKNTFYNALAHYQERTSDYRKHTNMGKHDMRKLKVCKQQASSEDENEYKEYGRTSDPDNLNEVIDAYLSNQITHRKALEMTHLERRVFNGKLYEYRKRTGDMRIPRG